MKKLALLAIVTALMVFTGVGSVGAASAPATFYLGDETFTGTGAGQAGNFPQIWDLTAGDLTLSYTIDMTGITQPAVWDTSYTEVGLRDVETTTNFNPGPWDTYQGGDGGWMTSLVGDLASNPTGQNLNDKHNLGASGGRGEGDYDVLASSPNTVRSSPIGSDVSYGIWFDRDGVDQWQATYWGSVDKGTYNTGGKYNIVVKYHAISSTLGTMFATVNGIQTGFYSSGWKNAQPEYYPAGLSFKGDMTQMQVFYGLWAPATSYGTVKVSNITVNGPLVVGDGMATGGGWFSPENTGGQGNVTPGGKATFDFVAKQKDNVSSGQLEFQYQTDKLSLKSTSYDWVTMSTTQAIFQGTGTLNGTPNKKFRVQAFDGDQTGGDDQFTIRIWTEGSGSYDSPTYRAEGNLGGGQIVVHK